MNRKLMNSLRAGAAAGLALALAACGSSDANKATTAPQQQPQGNLLTNINATGAPLDWAAQNGNTTPPQLPGCAPMLQHANVSTYRSAPSYAYRHDRVTYDEAPPTYDDYAYLGLAGSLIGVIGDSPPDYAFDYDGVEPWVWETGDGYYTYAEPIDYGYRYYFYAPGAAMPFLVRDPYYSYGYRNGGLAAIYDRDGRMLDPARAGMQRAAAIQYWSRAAGMRNAYMHGPHMGVPANIWAQRRGFISRDRNSWIAARAQQPAWRGWDAQHAAPMQARWSAEAVARRDAATRFNGWQANHFRGNAPQFYAEARQDPRVQMATQHERAVGAALAGQRQGTVQTGGPHMVMGQPGVQQGRGGDHRQMAMNMPQQHNATPGMQQRGPMMGAQQHPFAGGAQRAAFTQQAERHQMATEARQARLDQRRGGPIGPERREAFGGDRQAMHARQFQGRQVEGRQVEARQFHSEQREAFAGPRGGMGMERQAVVRQNFAQRAPMQGRGFEPHGGGFEARGPQGHPGGGGGGGHEGGGPRGGGGHEGGGHRR